MDDFVENTTSSMQQEEKKADDNDDIEKAVTATDRTAPYDAIQQFNHSNEQPSPRKKTIWTDDRGNLKVVNMVVRYPCVIFWLLIVLVILLTFILNALVFRTAENGNVSSFLFLRFNSTFLLVALSLNAFTVFFFLAVYASRQRI